MRFIRPKLIFCVFVLTIVGIGFFFVPANVLVCLVILSIVLIGAVTIIDDEILLISPLLIALGNILLGTVLRLVWVYLRYDEYPRSLITQEGVFNIGSTLLVISLFITCLVFGYILLKPLLFKKRSPSRLYKRRNKVFALLCITIAIVGMIEFLGTFEIFGLSDIVIGKKRLYDSLGNSVSYSYLRLLIYFAKFITIYLFLVSDKPTDYLVYKIVAILVLFTYATIASTRTDILYLFFAIYLLSVIKGSISLKTVLPLFVISIFLSTLTYSFRVASTDESFATNAIEGSLVNNNFADIAKTSSILAFYNDGRKESGATFLGVFTSFIPREIWKEKPPVFPGGIVTNDVYGRNDDVAGSIPPGIIGELFMNFGYAGVIIGGMLIGWMFKNWEAHGRRLAAGNLRNQSLPLLVYIFVTLELGLRLMGGSFSQFLLGVMELGPFILLFSLFRHKRWLWM